MPQSPPTNLLIPPFSASPSTRSTAALHILDSGARISNLQATRFLAPPLPGFPFLPIVPAWSYLITSHTTKRSVLFDLGVPRNWRTAFPPSLIARIDSLGWDVHHREKDLLDHLADTGTKLEDLDAAIWSHTHWDHIGDVHALPPSVALVVGPGFSAAHLPGYPSKADSPVPASAWAGRELREIDERAFAESGVRVGELPALDYFGDGSFYLVRTAGHTTEHLSALVRTTRAGEGGEEGEEDTFAFLGGDIVHHGSELRPSRHLPLPSSPSLPFYHPSLPCPGELFTPLLTRRGRSATEPFFGPAMGDDVALAAESIIKAQEADAKANVLFLFAHDAALLGLVEGGSRCANGWRREGLREKVLWAFLGDLVGAVEKEGERGGEIDK